MAAVEVLNGVGEKVAKTRFNFVGAARWFETVEGDCL